MNIEATQNELVIRETPGCLWIFGLFFAVIGGMLLWGTLGGFTNWGAIPPWQLAVAFVIASGGVAAGVWIIANAPVTKIVVDRLDETVSMTRYGIRGKSVEVFDFDEIARFRLVEDRDDEGSPVWFFGIELVDGELVKVTSLSSHSEEYERSYVFQTNVFMNKQMPPAQMICLLEDEDDDELR